MRERTVEAWFKRRVEATGGITRKAAWVNRAGCPDRWCGWPMTKKTGWVELKGDGGIVAPHQAREILRLRECGERVDVLVSLADVDKYIEEMTR